MIHETDLKDRIVEIAVSSQAQDQAQVLWIPRREESQPCQEPHNTDPIRVVTYPPPLSQLFDLP